MSLLFADIAYCEVELAGEFVIVAARWRGLGGQGWQECSQLYQVYARVVLAVNSARLLFADIAYCEVELAG